MMEGELRGEHWRCFKKGVLTVQLALRHVIRSVNPIIVVVVASLVRRLWILDLVLLGVAQLVLAVLEISRSVILRRVKVLVRRILGARVVFRGLSVMMLGV